MNRLLPLLLALAVATAPAQKPAKIPKDAPVCAAPDAPLLFLSPMGEPFRAAAGQPWPSAAWFARADADRDGRLTADEFVADGGAFFRTLDKDGDAALIPDEIAAYEAAVPEASLYRSRRPGEGNAVADRRRGREDAGYGGVMGAGRYGWLNIPQPIWSADLDLDRAVTAAEFAAAARKRFALLDTGRRGYLALADLGQTPLQAERAGPCRPRPPREPRR